MFCIMCGEYTRPTDELAEGHWFDEKGEQRVCHRECALRNVIGGIGHLTDHELWCRWKKDPDMGMTYRQSALAVDAWVREHGVEAAT
jgi:hypothetical protein